MRIIIDTITMTWKYDNYCNLFERLGLTETVTQPMRTKYYNFGEFYDGILIAGNRDESFEVTETYLSISGRGCRTVEELNEGFDWFEFLHYYHNDIVSKRCHIARLDVALDLTDDDLDIYGITMKRLYKYTLNELYVCKSKVLPQVVMLRQETIYFGSSKSDRILRIYNKALEQGIPDTYWLRFEFQLRNDCATSFYLNWINYSDIGTLYRGVLADFLRFVAVPKGMNIKNVKENRNQGRLPTTPWWDKLTGDVQKISQLYLPAERYTLANLERYLEKQTYSSLKAYVIAHDGDISKLAEGIKHAKLNNRQRVLLSELFSDLDKKSCIRSERSTAMNVSSEPF